MHRTAALLLGLVWSACGPSYSESDMQLQRDRVQLLQRMIDRCEQASRAYAGRIRELRAAERGKCTGPQ